VRRRRHPGGPALGTRRRRLDPTLPIPTWFLDNDTSGAALTAALRGLGVSVELLRDHFDPSTADADWIPEVADRDWIILTRDRSMRHRTWQADAVAATGARMFTIVTRRNLRGAELAELVGRAVNRVHRRAAKRDRGYIVKIMGDGSLEPWFPR
jgi:hypothetical protein